MKLSSSTLAILAIAFATSLATGMAKEEDNAKQATRGLRGLEGASKDGRELQTTTICVPSCPKKKEMLLR